MTEQRRVLLLAHPGRAQAHDVACQLVDALSEHEIEVRLLPDEAEALGLADNPHVSLADGGDPSADCELVVVIGGDGTILRAAEVAHDSGTPILGVNLGHVGFLAEAEYEDVSATIDAIVARRYIGRGAADDRRLGLPRRRVGDAYVRPERGERREGRAGAHARGRGRGRRATALAVGMRRGRVRDADRLDGVQLQCRWARRVARSRSAADGADQRSRVVRATPGGRPDLGARRRGDRPCRRRRASSGATADGRWTCRRARGSRYAEANARSGWCDSTRRRSPTGWWPSSGSRSRAGAVRANAGCGVAASA